MNQKHQKSIYHANVNINLMEENLIQIIDGIMINVDVNAKASYMRETLYLESCYMYLQKW